MVSTTVLYCMRPWNMHTYVNRYNVSIHICILFVWFMFFLSPYTKDNNSHVPHIRFNLHSCHLAAVMWLLATSLNAPNQAATTRPRLFVARAWQLRLSCRPNLGTKHLHTQPTRGQTHQKKKIIPWHCHPNLGKVHFLNSGTIWPFLWIFWELHLLKPPIPDPPPNTVAP